MRTYTKVTAVKIGEPLLLWKKKLSSSKRFIGTQMNVYEDMGEKKGSALKLSLFPSKKADNPVNVGFIDPDEVESFIDSLKSMAQICHHLSDHPKEMPPHSEVAFSGRRGIYAGAYAKKEGEKYKGKAYLKFGASEPLFFLNGDSSRLEDLAEMLEKEDTTLNELKKYSAL